MSKFQRVISFILIPAVLLLLVYMPQLADAALKRDRYHEWLEPEPEEFGGVITVWHIAGFKPYIGSLGSWLAQRARGIEKRHFGVYFEIESVTPEEAEGRIKNGTLPDVLSFPNGWCGGSVLAALTGEYPVETSSGMDMSVLRAAPYAASCSVILYYPQKVTAAELTDDPETAAANTLEDFKKGKVPCCIADARGAGDMDRALQAGKADYFEELPFALDTELVQYLGINRECEQAKLPYIDELFNAVFSEDAQSSLCQLGLMPLVSSAETQYERPFLADAYELISQDLRNSIPNTFDKWQAEAADAGLQLELFSVE